MKNINRISELENLIRYHNKLYHNLEICVSESGESLSISDDAYDSLISELKQLDPNNPLLSKVGEEVHPRGWIKEKHCVQMGSLNKCMIEEIDNSFFKNIPSHCFISFTLKYDGISIELVYESGKLIKAITRGDGEEGENIFNNVLKMKNIDKFKKFDHKENFSIKAEIIMMKEDFKAVNELENGKFSNPRNAASGIARGFEGKYCEYLTLKPHGVEFHNSEIQNTFTYESEIFGILGIFSEWNCAILKDNARLIDCYEHVKSARQQLECGIDGVVIKIDNLSEREKLGWVGGRPKWAIAIKFPAEAVRTTLEDIEWNVTRTGRVNPRARVTPVEIDGSIVEYATLHNWNFIKEKSLGLRDEVMIKKAGDIIPAIVEVVTHRYVAILPPTHCPGCGSLLENEGAYIFCRNYNCSAKKIARIQHFCRVLELDNVGDELLETLFNANLIQNISDLFFVKKEKMMALNGIGELTADNFLFQLKLKSKMTFDKFLISFGIDGLAEKNAKIISELYNDNVINHETLDDIISSIYDLSPKLFSEKTSEKIITGLMINSIEMCKVMEKVEIISLKKIEGVLSGNSFCITGPMGLGSREEYIKMIKDTGGEYKTSVGKGLTFLVTNDTESGTSKNKKAKELGIKIINENELRKMIKGEK